MEMLEMLQSEWLDLIGDIELYTRKHESYFTFVFGKLTVRNIAIVENFNLDLHANENITRYEFIDCVFSGEIVSSVEEVKHKGSVLLSFKNCEIYSFLSFGANIAQRVQFTSCRNIYSIEFQNNFAALIIEGESEVDDIILSLKISGLFSFNPEVKRDLVIQNYRISNFSILNFNSVNSRMFNSKFEFFTCERCENASFDIEEIEAKFFKIDFSGYMYSEKCSIKYMEIDTTYNGNVTELHINDLDSSILSLVNIFGNDNIGIFNSDIKSIYLGNVFSKSLEINSCKIELLVIPVKLLHVDNLRIVGFRTLECKISYLIIENGNFAEGSDRAKPNIYIEYLSVYSIVIDSFINNGNVFISNMLSLQDEIVIDTLSFTYGIYKLYSENELNIANEEILIVEYDKLDQDSDISVVNYKLKNRYDSPMFTISNSDMGKINFISCDFSIMTLKFKASKMTELFLSGTEMPSNVIGTFGDQQITYGQLKKVYESRGDSVKSNDYLGLELNAHYKAELEKFSWRKFLRGEHWDIVTLWLNKHSNDFGSSWSQALGWIFKLMIPIYIAHNFALGYSIDGSEKSWENFWELVSLFPEFLFPIHKADYISDVVKMPVTNWSRIWDVVGRIVSGYLIYQMVQAFRKFGKK